MIHQKKNRGHRTSKSVKSRKSYSNGHLPYHLFILLLSARAHDVAFEFACAVGCADTISANVLKHFSHINVRFAKYILKLIQDSLLLHLPLFIAVFIVTSLRQFDSTLLDAHLVCESVAFLGKTPYDSRNSSLH